MKETVKHHRFSLNPLRVRASAIFLSRNRPKCLASIGESVHDQKKNNTHRWIIGQDIEKRISFDCSAPDFELGSPKRKEKGEKKRTFLWFDTFGIVSRVPSRERINRRTQFIVNIRSVHSKWHVFCSGWRDDSIARISFVSIYHVRSVAAED